MANLPHQQIGETGGGAPNARTPADLKENLPIPGLARPQIADAPSTLSSTAASHAEPQGGADPFAWFTEALEQEKAAEAEPRVAREPKPGFRVNDRGVHVFAPGNKANVTKGRKGSRNKLATSFFHDMYELWEEQGQDVLRRAAFQDPVAFAAIVAKLMPQKIEISDTTIQDMENERLEQLLDFANRLAEQRGFDLPALEAPGGEGEAREQGAVEILPPLSQAT